MKIRKIFSFILALCVIMSILTLSAVHSAAAGPGQDEDGNDIIIHDSNEIDGYKISNMNDSTHTAYNRIINDGSSYSYGNDNYYDDDDYYGDDYGNWDDDNYSGMMVGRRRNLSASADEETFSDDESDDLTAEELSEPDIETSSAEMGKMSPNTGYTFEVAMVILLMLSAVIGIAVSVYNLSKKRG